MLCLKGGINPAKTVPGTPKKTALRRTVKIGSRHQLLGISSFSVLVPKYLVILLPAGTNWDVEVIISVSMNSGIIFNKSAFKHGVTEADIEWAFLHPIRNGLLEKYENKYLLIGFDQNGNLLEIMYNIRKDGSYNVFHAMKCRKEFYYLAEESSYYV